MTDALCGNLPNLFQHSALRDVVIDRLKARWTPYIYIVKLKGRSAAY
ncbi:hypothetical protein [Cypionkella sp. TWP1-2-1b2]